MKLSRVKNVFAWALVLGLLISCGAAYRIIAAGGIKGTATSTSNNLRQPIANTNGLIAWYPLDGDTKDYSGNHYDGTANNFSFDGTTNGWTSGKFGKGLLFNGSNDRVSISPVPQTPLNAITLSAWINPQLPQDATYNQGYILGGADEQNDIMLFCSSSTGPCVVYGTILASGTGSRISGTTNVPSGKFSLITLTYDSSLSSNQEKIYLNGVLEAQKASTGTIGGWGTFLIGSYGNPTVAFHGVIDDARVYNRALSQNEIYRIYAGSPSQNCDQTCHVWLKFDDNAGTSAIDSSGNSMTGTLTGNTTWATGNFASAVALDGNTSYVSVPDLGMTAGTVGMWINPATVSGDQRLLAQASGAATQAGQIALNQSSGENGSLWVWDGSAWQRLSTDGAVKTGQWNQIVMSNNGGTVTAYVNGTQQLTAASAFNFSGVAANIGGKFLGTMGGTFNGSVDDFRIYSRMLAPEEVADQWRQGT